MMYFTRKERIAILVCIAIAVGALWTRELLHRQDIPLVLYEKDAEWVQRHSPNDKFRKRALSMEPMKEDKAANPMAVEGGADLSKSMSNFDPNSASYSALLSAGVPAHVAKNIVNFRSKGGQFYKKEDLKQLYAITDSLYHYLEPFIVVESKDQRMAVALPDLDINQADTALWQTLNGIGPARARSICRFRDALGGFTSIDQVAETKNLPDSVFQKIRSRLILETPIIKLKINFADEVRLAAHPYISRKQASLLVRYRTQNGHYSDVASVRKSMAFMDEVELMKLAPYFDYSTD